MNAAIITLFEGHYHLGAAALLNSLHAHGFSGIFVCGHRGPRPAWAELTPRLSDRIDVRWVEITSSMHLTYYKPFFMREWWAKEGTTVDQLYYLDPDIVVKAPWTVLQRWAADGVALCEDVNGNFPSHHPYRLVWFDFFRRQGLTPVRPLATYYNAGFVGLPRALAPFLDTWIDIIERAKGEIGSLDKLKNAGPHALFHSADQDAMNMALLVNPVTVNATGPEGMDFTPGGHLLSHAAGRNKPWRGGFLKAALGGRPPGMAHKCFYDYADSPIPVFPPATTRRIRFELKLAGFIGRFYRRN